MNKAIVGAVGAMSIALSLACSSASIPAGGDFDGKLAIKLAEEHLAFGTRVPGSKGWQEAGDWMVAKLNVLADTVFEQRWTHKLVNGDSIPQRNIIAQFNPKSTERVLYVVHWDTRPIADNEADPEDQKKPIMGANDGASGVALLIALADALHKNKTSMGVDLLFVDGEDYGDFTEETDVLIGSKYFAQNIPWPSYRPLFGVVWDMIGGKDLKIYQEQNSLAGAPEVVTRVWKAAADAGHADVFIPQPKYAVMDDHIPLLEVGLRVIDVIDLDYKYHHSLQDTFDKLSEESLRKVGTVALSLVRTKE